MTESAVSAAGLEDLSQSRDQRILLFGWVLLFMWISSVIYMTREFFFPHIYDKYSDTTSFRRSISINYFTVSSFAESNSKINVNKIDI